MPEDLWGSYFGREIPRYLNETQNLADSENQGRRQAANLLTSTLAEPGFGYMTERDVQNIYGAESDESSRARLAGGRALGENLGGRGITGGGYASGLRGRLELAHLGNLATQKRGARQYQRDFNARQGMNRLQGQQVVGNILAQGKSDAFAQGLTNVMGLQLTRQGLESAERQAQLAANATKDAGKKNLLGGVLQGAFGLAGGLLA